MPLTPQTASIVSAGVDSASNGILALLGNRAQRRYNEKQYSKQRADALADWNMQNEYNSPAAQMERYKAAGLNPALIYGQSNVSQPVRSTDTKSYNPEIPRMSGAGNALMMAYDMKMKNANLDIAGETAENLREQRKLIQAQTSATLANAGLTTFNTEKGRSLLPATSEGLTLRNQKMIADTEFTKAQNIRNELITGKTMEKIGQDIISSKIQNEQTRTQIKNGLLDASLKQLDIELRKNGINPNDPMYARILGRILTKVEQYINDPATPIIKEGDSNLKKIISAWKVFK